MPGLRAVELVRVLFEERKFDTTVDGRTTELHAHSIDADGDEVVARGRIRVVDGASLADSPAAWRLRVRDGAVLSIVPETP